jgi:DNA-directed RNA polymerase specialized sigma24 family protein
MDSFFCGIHDGRFPELRNRKELWNLLLTIAYRKVIKHRKRECSVKRGGGKVHSVTDLTPDSTDETPFDAVDSEPTEEEICVAVEEMTEGLGDPVLRTIAVRRLHGYTDQEIAAELGVAERTIIRKRQRIQAIWQSELVD